MIRRTRGQEAVVRRLLAYVGDACAAYFDHAVRELQSRRYSRRNWSFCHAKERNLPRHKRDQEGSGDLWTLTAIDADTKLIVTSHLGTRYREDADALIRGLSERVESERVLIAMDGLATITSRSSGSLIIAAL